MRLDDNSSLEICRKKILEKYHGRRTYGQQGPGLRHEQRLGISSGYFGIFWETFLAIFLLLVKQ
jgi:hypothetical protein